MSKKNKNKMIDVVNTIDQSIKATNPDKHVRRKTVRQDTFEKWGSTTHKGKRYANAGWEQDQGQYGEKPNTNVSDDTKAIAEAAAKKAAEAKAKQAAEAKAKQDAEAKAKNPNKKN